MSFLRQWLSEKDDDQSVEEFSVMSPCGSFGGPDTGMEKIVQYITGPNSRSEHGRSTDDGVDEEASVVSASSNLREFLTRFSNVSNVSTRSLSVSRREVPYEDLGDDSSESSTDAIRGPLQDDLQVAATSSTMSSSEANTPPTERGSFEDPDVEAIAQNLDAFMENVDKAGGAKDEKDEGDAATVTSSPSRGYHTDRFRIVTKKKIKKQQSDIAKKRRALKREQRKHLLEKISSALTFDTTSEEFIALTKDRRPAKPREDCSWFAFGKLLTPVAVISCLLALVFAVIAKRSDAFVQLEDPIQLSPLFDPVNHIGLVRMELCYNETARVIDPAMDGAQFTAGATFVINAPKGCYDFVLSPSFVDDAMWEVARVFLSLAIALGSFFTLMLATSVIWESINLKPIAIGLLVTYFCQLLSFFFFDSQLCRRHNCALANGSILSIVASMLWFVAGLACIRMDVVYQGKQRLLEKRLRRAKRKELHKLKLEWKAAQQKAPKDDDLASTTETITTPLSTPGNSPAKARPQQPRKLSDEELFAETDLERQAEMFERNPPTIAQNDVETGTTAGRSTSAASTRSKRSKKQAEFSALDLFR